MLKIGPLRNVDELQKFLKTLPRGMTRAAIRAFAEYLIGNSYHGFRHDQPYKYVSRAKAYGKVASGVPAGYFSMRQYRYVMAKIASGEINPGQRRNIPTKASGGYEIKETRGGYGANIVNQEAGAYWTRSDKNQPRQLARVGWRKAADVVAANIVGGIRSAKAAISQFLKR